MGHDPSFGDVGSMSGLKADTGGRLLAAGPGLVRSRVQTQDVPVRPVLTVRDAMSHTQTADGIHYIVETKGLEDTNVVNKDRAAQLWCENTTRLASKPWAYLKVLQTAYRQLQPTRFEDLFVLATPRLA